MSRHKRGEWITIRQLLAIVPREHRLGIKTVDLRESTVEKDVDYRLGPGRKVRPLRTGWHRSKQVLTIEQPGQTQHPEPHAGPGEQGPPRDAR